MLRLIAHRPLLSGGILVLTARGVAQLFRIAGVLFLARLLGPDAFGVVGIAMIAMAAMTTVTDTGFDAALVQHRGDIRPYLSTVFCVKIGRAALIGAALYALSPIIAAFFHNPQATQVLRALTPVVLLEGLTNPAVVAIRRDLQFRRIAVWDLAEAVTGLLAAVLFGLWLGTVFAIVLAMVAAQLTRTVTSYILVPFVPRLQLQWVRAAELAGFGVWILLTNTVVFMLLYIDDIAVSRILGAAALGLYQVAFRISNMPTTELSHVVAQLAYPAYAQVQTDLVALRRLWLGVLGITASVAAPAAAVVALTASDIVSVVLGPDWTGAVPVIQVLALFGVLRAFNAASSTLFNAMGRPRILALISTVQLAVLGIAIVPGVLAAGLEGAAWAITAANALALGLVLKRAAELLSVRMHDVLLACRSALAITAGFVVPLLIMRVLFTSLTHRLAATLLVVTLVTAVVLVQRLSGAAHTLGVRS